jgi:hypothetical protein
MRGAKRRHLLGVDFSVLCECLPLEITTAGTARSALEERIYALSGVQLGVPGRPWDGPHAYTCGAAGAPCPWCNVPAPGKTPRLPDSFKTEVDKDGRRH